MALKHDWFINKGGAFFFTFTLPYLCLHASACVGVCVFFSVLFYPFEGSSRRTTRFATEASNTVST